MKSNSDLNSALLEFFYPGQQEPALDEVEGPLFQERGKAGFAMPLEFIIKCFYNEFPVFIFCSCQIHPCGERNFDGGMFFCFQRETIFFIKRQKFCKKQKSYRISGAL